GAEHLPYLLQGRPQLRAGDAVLGLEPASAVGAVLPRPRAPLLFRQHLLAALTAVDRPSTASAGGLVRIGGAGHIACIPASGCTDRTNHTRRVCWACAANAGRSGRRRRLTRRCRIAHARITPAVRALRSVLVRHLVPACVLPAPARPPDRAVRRQIQHRSSVTRHPT